MASAELNRRVGKVVGYQPLSEMGDQQRREFHEALLDVDSSKTCMASGRRRSSAPSRTGRSCCASSTASESSGRWRSVLACERPAPGRRAG
jgi:hypothetical protein